MSLTTQLTKIKKTTNPRTTQLVSCTTATKETKLPISPSTTTRTNIINLRRTSKSSLHLYLTREAQATIWECQQTWLHQQVIKTLRQLNAMQVQSADRSLTKVTMHRLQISSHLETPAILEVIQLFKALLQTNRRFWLNNFRARKICQVLLLHLKVTSLTKSKAQVDYTCFTILYRGLILLSIHATKNW